MKKLEQANYRCAVGLFGGSPLEGMSPGWGVCGYGLALLLAYGVRG